MTTPVFETDRLLDYGDDALLDEVRRVARLVPDPVLSRARFDALLERAFSD